MKQILTRYLNDLQKVMNRGDAREESFYHCVKEMLESYAKDNGFDRCEVSILPKTTEAGNPDFRVWDGKTHITGYVEAKKPETYLLKPIADSEQLKRYRGTFDNLILTNFYEFWLFQYGEFVCGVTIANPLNATQSQKTPPLTNKEDFDTLLDRYFSFSLPAIKDPVTLAKALAKRTRFLRDEIIAIELLEEEKENKKVLLNFYDSIRRLLINNLTPKDFADLYAQTLTYGVFAARTRSEGDFNRSLIYQYIPNTLGILKSIFKFISFEELPKPLEVLIDDITDILCITDIQQILHSFSAEGKGRDPIVHFYETFLSEYDPALRSKRGVYYTPEPVVRYIVRGVHSLLKSHFGLADGLASPEVTILDPAAGTLTFPAEAINLAIAEHKSKYGAGGVHKLIKGHILPHFHAIELMMAPYTVGHLKISYLLAEHGYEMDDDERFKLYLSNTLEQDVPVQTTLSMTHEISEECALADKVKHQETILVIMGNPPYSYDSGNTNPWTEKLLKTDLDGAQSFYKVDGKHLEEKNPKGLQDDYVKFLRFAQWKIHKAGKGIVGMITNHGYLDNPTFRGMRQSLMNTFDEIYVLDLHGNSKKKETSPDGSKDESVFDIQQGTAIILMIKNCPNQLESNVSHCSVFHQEIFGLRSIKYDWLNQQTVESSGFTKFDPTKPFYLLQPIDTQDKHYLDWLSITQVFKVTGVGLYTARDNLTIHFSENNVKTALNNFSKLDSETARIVYSLGEDTSDWKVSLAQKDLLDSKLAHDNFMSILYRPFDIRHTYYTGRSRGIHCRPRYQTMRHLLEDNISIIVGRQGLAVGMNQSWNLVFIGNEIVDYNVFYRGGEILAPLYLYPDMNKEDIFASDERSYNIAPEILAGFSKLWPQFQPEQLFYYVYAILHSNIYRKRYAQYLRMDFPRVPLTEDFALFSRLAELGRELADIHLLKSPRLNPPVAKYQGGGTDDSVEQIQYDPGQGIVRINENKYFEGISPEVWNYHIGGYQVMHKYLKDRKGKPLADPIYYCRIATALAQTISLQMEIDKVYASLDPS